MQHVPDLDEDILSTSDDESECETESNGDEKDVDEADFAVLDREDGLQANKSDGHTGELFGDELLSDGDDESLEAQLPSVLQKITATIGEGDDIDAADDDDELDEDDVCEDANDIESEMLVTSLATKDYAAVNTNSSAGSLQVPDVVTQSGKATCTQSSRRQAAASVAEVFEVVGRSRRGRSRGVDLPGVPEAKRRRKGRPKGGLSAAISKMLGEANMCYVSQDFSEAIRLLEEVVRQAPKAADPYQTLGLVYEEMGDAKRALESHLVAAYLIGRDADTWKRVATMSQEQGLYDQAIYCIGRVLRLTPSDYSAQFARASLLMQVGHYKRGAEAYRTLLRYRPHDATVAAELARIHDRRHETAAALEVLTKCLNTNIDYAKNGFPLAATQRQRQVKPKVVSSNLKVGEDEEASVEQDDMTDHTTTHEYFLQAQMHLANIICELHMTSGAFDKAIEVIQALEQRGVYSKSDMPLDLSVKVGICFAHCSEGADDEVLSQSDARLSSLYNHRVEEYPDLYLDVGEAYVAIGSHAKAILIYEELLKVPEYDQPGIWLKLGRCHKELSEPTTRRLQPKNKATLRTAPHGRASHQATETHAENALEFYGKVLVAVPSNCEAAMATAELHEARGRSSEALTTLQQVNIRTARVPIVPGTDVVEEGDATVHLNRHSSGYELWHGPTDAPMDGDAVRLAADHALLLHRSGRSNTAEYLMMALPLLFRSVGLRCQGAAVARAIVKRQRHGQSTAADNPHNLRARNGEGDRAGLEAASKHRRYLQQQRRRWRSNAGPPTIFEVLDRETFSELAMNVVRVMVNHQATLCARASDKSSSTSDRRAMAKAALWVAHMMLPNSGSGSATGADLSRRLLSEASRAIQPAFGITPDARKALRFDEVVLSNELNDYSAVHDSIAHVVSQRPRNIAVWNLYYSIVCRLGIQHFDSLRTPFVRMLLQNPDSLPLLLLVGHQCAANRDMGVALAEYLHAFRKSPKDPLISLLIGVSYLTMVMQKNTLNRHQVALRAFTFLSQYYRLRGERPPIFDNHSPTVKKELADSDATVKCGTEARQSGSSGFFEDQERNYNMGRAYHQIGLVHLAVPYYERVLANFEKREISESRYSSAETSSTQLPPHARSGLRREAAYNLVQIYKASGSLRVARHIMRKHLTI